MAKHLQRDLDHLKHEILAVGTLVEEAIDKSLRLLKDRDAALIDEIIDGDDRSSTSARSRSRKSA